MNGQNSFDITEIDEPCFDSYVSFDIETTGLRRNSQILEIGAVKVENGSEVGYFSELINNLNPVPAEITALTGITTEEIEKYGGDLKETLEKFRDFIGDKILIGHNIVSFDCPIIGYNAYRTSLYFNSSVFDTLKYLRQHKDLFKFSSRSLCHLTDVLGIETKVHHRAQADAEATEKLYEKIKTCSKNGIILNEYDRIN